MSKTITFLEKHGLKITLLFLFFLMSFFWYMGYTSDSNEEESYVVMPKATVQPLIDQKQSFSDSLMLLIVKQLNNINNSKQMIVIEQAALRSDYQSSLQHAPDTCLPYLNSLYKQATKLDSVNQSVIKRQDSTIVDFSKVSASKDDVIALQKYQMQQKTDSIVQLKEDKKFTKKNDKRQRVVDVLKKIGSNVLSFAAGYGTGKIIP